MEIIIKGGVVVSPGGSYAADVRIINGVIDTVAEGLPVGAETVIDASGMLVFPGFIDSHTHFDMEAGAFHTADDFESGTAAAVLGGTTAVLDFATQEKGGTLLEALAEWQRKAGGNSACDYGFHMAITDWNPLVAGEIPLMLERGVTSFKVYMAYDALRLSDAAIYEVLKAVGDIGGVVGVHCENGDLVSVGIAEQKVKGGLSPKHHPLSRPNIVESEAVNRLLTIAELAKVPVNIVHISTREGLDVVRRARAKGQEVYVETCPQYLLLDASVYNAPGAEGAKFICSPPMRSKADVQALWTGIHDGQLDTIGTDHCSFRYADQKKPVAHDFSAVPNGMPGVQNRPALIYSYGVLTGKMTQEDMSALLSENIARLFGMYPRKGTILPGSDADIVVWNPRWKGTVKSSELAHKTDYTPFEGIEISGRAEHVLLRGEHVVAGGMLKTPACGAYISRSPGERYRRTNEI